MYISFLIGLSICQSNQVLELPRIQAIPIQITYQTQRKPVLQETPPSSFVPPNSSFDSSRLFVPASQEPLGDQTKSSTFQGVDANQVKPLRSTNRENPPPPKTSFSIGSGTNSQQIPPTAQPFTVKPASPSTASVPPKKQFDPQGTSIPKIGSAEITPAKPADTKPASAKPASAADTTFDPQLREISELILKSIQRTNENRLSLAKAVSYAHDSAHRKQIIKQYWSCFANLADLQFASQEVSLLSSIHGPATQQGPAAQLNLSLMRAALSSAEARLSQAKMAYQKSALLLAKLVPTIDPTSPICFADLPWVGKYRTNSEGFVQSGMFDQKIRTVDKVLPGIRDLVYLRGAAVYDNLVALRESIAGLEKGTVRLETVLHLHTETRDQRIEFFKATRDYNHAIADYAISVFPTTDDPQTVAKMLIDVNLTLPGTTMLDPNVRQASRRQ